MDDIRRTANFWLLAVTCSLAVVLGTQPRWSRAGQLPGADVLLRDIVPLHYRYRFDPAGLDPELSHTFRDSIDRWLSQHQKRGRGD